MNQPNTTPALIEELYARTAHSARPKATVDKPLFRRAALELDRLQSELENLKNPETLKKRAYLNNSNRCPHCRSENIEGLANREMNNDQVTCGVDCLDCKKTWVDIYTLTDVELT